MGGYIFQFRSRKKKTMLRIIAHETKRLTRVNSVFTDVTDVLWDVTSRHVTYLERNKGNSYEN